MSTSNSRITAYVLAGGKSTRMGKDKGLMLLGGKRMVEHVIAQVKPCVDELVIVANDPAYKNFGYKVIEDLEKGLGPIGGLYSALKDTQTLLNFIVSCDMPFIKTEAVKYVITKADKDVTVPTSEGKIQPLFGVYSKNCLKKIEESIRENKLKMMRLITALDSHIIAIEESGLKTEALFNNINTQEEYALALKAQEIWKQK